MHHENIKSIPDSQRILVHTSDDIDREIGKQMEQFKDKKKGIVCVCNFTPVTYTGFVFGLPAAGSLKEILNSDDEAYGGEGQCNKGLIRSRDEGFLDLPASAAITLPAMSAVFFEYKQKVQRTRKTAKKGEKKK